MEANPIAGYFIRLTQPVSALAAYKMLTVGICVGLLYRLRRHAAGEMAAWYAMALLALMSHQWHDYARQCESLDNTAIARNNRYGDDWLTLD